MFSCRSPSGRSRVPIPSSVGRARPEHELDVVRAYVILSNSRDAKRLVTDFRFSTYGLLRRLLK